jgi:hypothetical protein
MRDTIRFYHPAGQQQPQNDTKDQLLLFRQPIHSGNLIENPSYCKPRNGLVVTLFESGATTNSNVFLSHFDPASPLSNPTTKPATLPNGFDLATALPGLLACRRFYGSRWPISKGRGNFSRESCGR